MSDNLTRMIALADEVFAMHEDAEQLSVDDSVIERLHRIHPQALSEARNEDGPIAWMLLLPTTTVLMERFVREEISERELYDMTPEPGPFDALYLCSAIVLPEFRQQRIATCLLLEAARSIMRDHPIRSLCVWTFTDEGKHLARSVSRTLGLPLLERTKR